MTARLAPNALRLAVAGAALVVLASLLAERGRPGTAAAPDPLLPAATACSSCDARHQHLANRNPQVAP